MMTPAPTRRPYTYKQYASQRSAMAGVHSLRLDWRLFRTVSEIENFFFF